MPAKHCSVKAILQMKIVFILMTTRDDSYEMPKVLDQYENVPLHIVHCTVSFKCSGSVRYFVKFSKDALHLSKFSVKICIMLQKIS